MPFTMFLKMWVPSFVLFAPVWETGKSLTGFGTILILAIGYPFRVSVALFKIKSKQNE